MNYYGSTQGTKNRTNMKYLLISLAFLALVQVSNGQSIPVTVDTIYLDVKEFVRPGSDFQLTHAIKSKGRYYCFFDESYHYTYGKVDKKHLFVMSDTGEDINYIDFPEDIDNTTYFDFFVMNDSIFAKIYQDRKCYYLDTTLLKWKEVPEVDDIVHEDDEFKVTYLDFGEWGQGTWFINKETGIQYKLDINSNYIIKNDGRYFITNVNSVIEIANPELLQLCKEPNYYENLKGKYPKEEITSTIQVINYIYYDSLLRHPLITSFIMNNEFYQVYLDDSVSYIGRIISDSLVPVQKLGSSSFFNWYYSYRGQSGENKLLKFIESFNTYSLADIDNQRINITYLIHNHDSLNYLGTDSFNDFLTILSGSKGGINFKQAANFEMSSRSVDLKADNLFLDFDSDVRFPKDDFQSKRFVKVINRYVAQTSEYIYNRHNDSVKFIRIDWCSTEPWDYINENEDNKAAKIFSQKQEEIIGIITSLTGNKPFKKKTDKYGTDLYWKLPNGTLKLTYNKSFEVQKWIGLEISFD